MEDYEMFRALYMGLQICSNLTFFNLLMLQ